MAEQVNIASKEFIGANGNVLRQCFTELGIDADITPENVENAMIALGDKFTDCLNGWLSQEANFDGNKAADTVKDVVGTLKQQPSDVPAKKIMGLNPILFYGLLITVVLLIVYFVSRARTHSPA